MAKKPETTASALRPQSPHIELVRIPPGSFMMGSNAYDETKPVHSVTINYSFYMGKYEVTQAQWEAVMGNNPSLFKDCGNCPVENVSWNDVHNFIEKLNRLSDGFQYRLPTEAEWEYACRAGSTGDYAGKLDDMAWYSQNSESRTHAVGQKQPNAWGLADMYGNVSEWCEDWRYASYTGAPADGTAWLSGDGGEKKVRVIRGGSWRGNAVGASSAFRVSGLPYIHDSLTGLRVVAVSRTAENVAQLEPKPVSRSNSRKIVIASIRSVDSPEGTIFTITADAPLNDYEAYRRGDRWYVRIPDADASRVTNSLVQILRNGNDVIISVRLQPGQKGRVEQKFNRIEIILSH